MISAAQALQIAQQYIASVHGADYDVVLQEEFTREEEFGWVFFYQSRPFLESGHWRDKLIGIAPFIVDRATGDLVHLGTRRQTEHYIEDYREQWRQRNRCDDPDPE